MVSVIALAAKVRFTFDMLVTDWGLELRIRLNTESMHLGENSLKSGHSTCTKQSHVLYPHNMISPNIYDYSLFTSLLIFKASALHAQSVDPAFHYD